MHPRGSIGRLRMKVAPSPPTRIRDGAPWRRGLMMLALVAAVFAAYAPTWQAGFIWDDDLHVTANPAIIGPPGLKEIWTTPAANYFPLTMTTFWILHALFGLNPLPYHLVNVLCHALSALLLWAVLRQFRIPGAGFGAAAWALHPVQVESVAWISELKNTQSAVFFLLAVWYYARRLAAEYGPAGRPRTPAYRSLNYAAALLCAVLAVLSKSSTVMLPVVLILCAWGLRRPRPAGLLGELLPFFALSLAISGWTIWEQKYSAGAAGAEWSHSLAQRAAIAVRVPWFYLGKLLWPAPLIFIYPRWATDAGSVAILLFGLASLGAGGWLYVRAESAGWARAAFWGLATFLALLFPVLGFFDVYFFRFSFVGDHFQYLASMAALALGGAVLARLPGTTRLILGAAALLGGAGMTWRQAHVYRSDLTLFTDTVAKNPAAWMAQSNLSAALADAGRPEEAITHARRALDLQPAYVEAASNLGRALTLSGRPEEALGPLQRAIATRPDYGEAHTNLGIAFAALNRDEDARRAFETALRLKPESAPAHYNLGQALAKMERMAEALPHFAAAIRLQPDHSPAEMSWGLGLAALGRFDEAWPHLDRALELAPNSPEIHTGYGRALAVAGRLAEAEAQLRRALQLDPKFAEAHLNLALILQHVGRTNEAAEHFQAANRPGAPSH